MSKFQQIFHLDLNKKPWYKDVLWWEIRRVPYNVFLLVFGFLSLELISILPSNGYFKLYAGPALVVWTLASLLLFFIVANVCYTGGWIMQLLTRNFNNHIIKKHLNRLFIYGLIVSFVVLFIPIILLFLNLILPDELMELVDRLITSFFGVIN